MSINDIIQKKRLLQKIGLGTPQISSSVTKVSQSQPPSNAPKPNNPPTQPTQSTQPSTNPQPKPGCGGCRRKRS